MFGMLESFLRTPIRSWTLPTHPKSFLEAPWRLLRKVEFSLKSWFFVSQKNLSSHRKFSQTHRQTQQLYSWVCLDLAQCSRVNWIHIFWNIFIFVSKNHTFLTAQLKHDFQANRITLRARKALRVKFWLAFLISTWRARWTVNLCSPRGMTRRAFLPAPLYSSCVPRTQCL